MSRLIDHVPNSLLDDLSQGRWLPLIGAGFSRNAVVQDGRLPVTWAELGRELAGEVIGADPNTSPLEILSAYEHTFGRLNLIDRTSKLIRAHDAAPGPAHVAFAHIGFANVITTNFDFLLEKAYDRVGKGCLPIVDEAQLSTRNLYSGPRVIKLHSDVNHPTRMVITEDDYDQFLLAYPLLATSVTAMLIDHTAVLVGYSLDDPDTRQLLALIKRRLGRMTRPLWTIQVDAPSHIVNRYERRGVNVINLPARRGRTVGEQLETLFTELGEFWRENLPRTLVSTDDRVTADLRVPDEPSRMCYFAVPPNLLGWYRDVVFPVVEHHGLIPVAAADVVTPQETIATKVDALIERAAVVVIERGSSGSDYEAKLVFARKEPHQILVIAEQGTPPTFDVKNAHFMVRPKKLEADPVAFIHGLSGWLEKVDGSERLHRREPERLLAQREYGASLISAVSMLERKLAAFLAQDLERKPGRQASVRLLLLEARNHGLFDLPGEFEVIEEAISARNEVLHRARVISAPEANRFVSAIRRFVDKL
ncbi:SIR2 family NAD-dependent protein deacylase [Pseudarthrobacter sp. NPDC092424]|uniref:SIR2 family NAD-dependent protein deacylase n=1 Tax=Pseudarthrobacter sp. NPDC092424 TaxID=3364415 RepID=UPI0038095F9F